MGDVMKLNFLLPSTSPFPLPPINTRSIRSFLQFTERFRILLSSNFFSFTINKMSTAGGRGKGGKSKSASKAIRSARAGLQFLVGRIHRLLRKGRYFFYLFKTYISLYFF
jgi:hypothetical protein